MDQSTQDQLFLAAIRACVHSYSPYSHFPVGAAVLAGSGKIYAGTNVENVSYGATMCAERVAIYNAISEGETEILALAVYVHQEEGVMPCGMCLQVLSEFAGDIPVLVSGYAGMQSFTLNELLPHRFKK